MLTMQNFHNVLLVSDLVEKVRIYSSVKIGKAKANTIGSLVQTHHGMWLATFGYVNSLTYVFLWGDET